MFTNKKDLIKQVNWALRLRETLCCGEVNDVRSKWTSEGYEVRFDGGQAVIAHFEGRIVALAWQQMGDVERLIASLEASRDNSIEQLIGYLFRITDWYDTTIRHWFTATLFPNIDLANLCGFTDHRWANYLGLRTKAIDIEQRIAEEYVSPEQLAVFRDEVFAMSWDFSCEPSAMPNLFEHCQGDAENGGEHFSLTQRSHAQVIERLRSVIVSVLQGNTLNIQSLRDIVDFMRKHDAQFPEFRRSATYKLFEPPIFENKKKYSGYFF